MKAEPIMQYCSFSMKDQSSLTKNLSFIEVFLESRDLVGSLV
jgi:hypothetical protein